MERNDGRALDALREITFSPHVAPHATGSVLVSFGKTRVICSAMIEDGVPNWMRYQKVAGGWLTAEYNMLPYSTLERKARDISRGRLDGRSSEIQRLIGRSLRAVVDLKALGPRTAWVDCDVLQADGGTRTASITGACVALALGFQKLVAEKAIKRSPLKQLVAAVSAGVVDEVCCLDLDYPEDKDATVDFNYVLTEGLDFVEVQGSGEEATFSEAQMAEMTALSKKGVTELVAMQRAAIRAGSEAADSGQIEGLAAHFGGE
jgi:ribonuclease PH